MYLYDRAGDASRKDKVIRAQQIRKMEPVLPINTAVGAHKPMGNGFVDSPLSMKSPLSTVMEKGTSWIPQEEKLA